MNQIEISSIADLLEKINCYPNNFAFRGQAESDWGLQSTLERMVPNSQERGRFEERSLEQFKAKFKLYSKDMDSPEKKLSWLSLMQHYGVPTRLLDFTTSPYVALYFAIESLAPAKDGFFSIYAIDCSALVENSCKHVLARDRGFEKYSDHKIFYKTCENAFEDVLDVRSYDVLWFVDPIQINNRLEKQSGTFLISGSFEKSIDDILQSDIYKNVLVEKINIPHKFYENIYALLRKINLGPKGIYGDLHGLALDIRLEMKIYSLPNS
jgi:hypothetical protein